MTTLRFVTAALILATSAACFPGRSRVGVGVAVVHVGRQPPAERVEVISGSPGPSYRWIKGYWAYRNNDYVWIPGRWEAPAAGFREWVPGRWQHDREGWFFVEGHWR